MKLPFGLGSGSGKGPTLDTSAEMKALQELAEQYAESNPEEYQWNLDLGYQELDPDSLAQLESSQMEGIEVDPRYAEAEQAALMQLQEMSTEGLTARDRADMAQIEGNVNRNLRGQRGAIEQNMQQRGISGSGLELVAQQQAAQSAIDRQAYAGLEKAAQMQGNKRAATMDLGNMSSQLSQRDYQREAQKAAAADAIARFNTQNTNTALSENNSGQNQANRYNNAGRQNTSSSNVSARNAHAESAYQARNNAARMDYDAKVDSYNQEMLKKQQEDAARKGKMGAVLGTAGAVVGGIYGGPAGAAAGASVGQGVGQAVAARGGKVPGEANGIDDYAEDTFNVNLQGGEIVIPDSISHDPELSAEFVEHVNESGPEGEIPARNPVEEPKDDVIGMFIETVNNLSKRRK